jgi:two-component system phosphate regulon response regulator OmpR
MPAGPSEVRMLGVPGIRFLSGAHQFVSVCIRSRAGAAWQCAQAAPIIPPIPTRKPEMSTNGRVLVVDDDASIRDMLDEYLSTHGYEVVQADSGEGMRAEIARALPDVVLLDVNMPGEDGLSLARWLRQHHALGIIMVTAAGDVVDRVVGLEVGADDYVAKPFDPRELRARVKSVLRRCQERGQAAAVPQRGRRIAVGHCQLDLDAHRLLDREGREVDLTTMEFELLQVFTAHPNQVLSRDQLLTLTRNREWEPFDRSIDIRIARLRRKIEPDPERPQLIRTMRGSGYMFVPMPA